MIHSELHSGAPRSKGTVQVDGFTSQDWSWSTEDLGLPRSLAHPSIQ